VVEEELPLPGGLVIVDVTMTIGADMTVEKNHLPPLDLGVAVLKVGFALPQRLYLSPHQHNPRLQLLEDKVIVKRFLIGGDDPKVFHLIT